MNTGYEGVHVLIDDNPVWNHDPIQQAQAACQGGAHVIQLRAKCAPDRQVCLWARTLRDMTREAGARFVVNDRFDIALESGSRRSSPRARRTSPPEEVRELVGDRHPYRALHPHAGRSDTRPTLFEPVDYVAFGPVFGTTSKKSPVHGSRGLPDASKKS